MWGTFVSEETPSMDQPAAIRHDTDGTVWIELSGDIDYVNADTVVNLIREALAERGPARVTVDLRAVTFLDSSGIGVLVITNQLATALGAAYEVHEPTRNVYEQLRITGLAELFGIAAPTGG
jgi:anti-sigma B factor antagonist